MPDPAGLNNTIAGKIITASTGTGIPDLLVVAWDFDPVRTTNILEEANGVGATKAFDASASRDGVVRAVLEAVEANPNREDLHPQRLGSVLTERDGTFLLTYEDDLFVDAPMNKHRSGADRRPDLLLLVLAPDQPSAGGQGRSISERLLYFTRPVSFEAGRFESLVVRIDEDRLTEFGVGIRFEEREATLHRSAQYQAQLARQYNDSAARLTVNSQTIEKYLAPKMAVENKLLSGILPRIVSTRIGSSQAFVGINPAELAVDAATGTAMQNIQWFINATAPRTGRVYLSSTDIDQLNLTSSALATPSGQDISFLTLLTHIGYSSGLVRNRNLLSQVLARRELASFEVSSKAPSANSPAQAGKPNEAALRVEILKRLQEQVEGLARPGERADPANDLSRIRGTVEQLEQAAGIGNAAATQDMGVLQVAFEPIWTAAFDVTLKKQIKELFRLLVKKDGSSALGDPAASPADVESVEQLRELLQDIASSAKSVSILGLATATIAAGSDSLDEPENDPVQMVGRLAEGLSKKLNEPYSFSYFARGSVNYGILQTYRQNWHPISYQVGRMVDSIALAASESRSIKSTVTVKRRGKISGRDFNSIKRLDEITSVSRTEIDAIDKISMAMTGQSSVKGAFNIGIASIDTTTTFGLNQAQESQRVHKSFSEIALKSSQELRRELEVQYEIETTEELSSESSRTLHNANDEMAITYLLYELDRRYSVRSALESVQPVVLVPLPFPKPEDIDDVWLLQNSWIIRDVLLEPAFADTLTLLENSRSRDEAQLAIFKATYDAASAIREKADVEFERLSQLTRSLREDVIGLGQRAKQAEAKENILTDITGVFFSGADSNDDSLRAEGEAKQRALDYLERETAAAAEVRDRSVAALNEATERFGAAVAAKTMADQKLLQLRLHVRGNIFHYMHEIWKRRDKDDLFFSLYDTEVPFIEMQPGQCKIRVPTPEERYAEVPGAAIPGEMYMVDVYPANKVPSKIPRKQLIEVADIDRPIGFKGNFAIFPLKAESLLTSFMMVSFLDGHYGIADPALGTPYSTSDLLDYAESIWNDPVVGLSSAEKDKLADLAVRSALRNPGQVAEIVLPTGKVWMEALKGGQALLEPFKLAHRALDVLKVEEEVRRERIDNLRRVQRVGLEDPKLSDPDVDKVTFVQGLKSGVILDPDA